MIELIMVLLSSWLTLADCSVIGLTLVWSIHWPERRSPTYPAATDKKKIADSHASSETFSDKFFEVSPHNGLVENWIINFSLAQAISSDNAINMPFVFRSFFARLAFPFKSPTSRKKTLPLVLCSLCFSASRLERIVNGAPLWRRKEIYCRRRRMREGKKTFPPSFKATRCIFLIPNKKLKALDRHPTRLGDVEFPIHRFGLKWWKKGKTANRRRSRADEQIWFICSCSI